MSTYFLFLSDKGPTLETLDYIIRIGSTPTFSYFNFHVALLCRRRLAAHYSYYIYMAL